MSMSPRTRTRLVAAGNRAEFRSRVDPPSTYVPVPRVVVTAIAVESTRAVRELESIGYYSRSRGLLAPGQARSDYGDSGDGARVDAAGTGVALGVDCGASVVPTPPRRPEPVQRPAVQRQFEHQRGRFRLPSTAAAVCDPGRRVVIMDAATV